ncbi:hypothetical protein C5167_029540 [Papaver somniferum]|nr:hypothetical protein C5167_029540 [Papaver somniferum]
MSILLYGHVLAFLVPAGLIACFLPLSAASSLDVLYTVTPIYFSGVMRMLIFSPAGCIMAEIYLSGAFDVFTGSVKFQLPGLPGDSDKRFLVLPLEASIIALLLLILLGAFSVVSRKHSSVEETLPDVESIHFSRCALREIIPLLLTLSQYMCFCALQLVVTLFSCMVCVLAPGYIIGFIGACCSIQSCDDLGTLRIVFDSADACIRPSSSIMAGIALSGAFDVITCSVKFQLPGLLGDRDAGDIITSGHVVQNGVSKGYSNAALEKSEETLKELTSKKNQVIKSSPLELDGEHILHLLFCPELKTKFN